MCGALHELTVTVVDQGGNVQPEAIVCIVRSPVVMPEVARLTNSLGQCRLRLSPGEYVFEAFADEGNLKVRQSILIPEQDHVRLELTSGKV